MLTETPNEPHARYRLGVLGSAHSGIGEAADERNVEPDEPLGERFVRERKHPKLPRDGSFIVEREASGSSDGVESAPSNVAGARRRDPLHRFGLDPLKRPGRTAGEAGTSDGVGEALAEGTVGLLAARTPYATMPATSDNAMMMATAILAGTSRG